MAKYRVLEGGHAQGGKFYEKGQTFESESDLLRFNRATPPRIARIEGGDEVVSVKTNPKGNKVDDGYDKLSFNDLKEIAEGEEILLTGEETREELIDKLRGMK